MRRKHQEIKRFCLFIDNLTCTDDLCSTWCNIIANIMEKGELRRQGTLPEMVIYFFKVILHRVVMIKHTKMSSVESINFFFNVSFSCSLLEPLGPCTKSMGFPVNYCFKTLCNIYFGALKQIKSGLWDADDTTLALKCQKGVQKSFNKLYFCDIFINIGERTSVQIFFAPNFNF